MSGVLQGWSEPPKGIGDENQEHLKADVGRGYSMSLAPQGSILRDFASTVFCPMCALCQLKRDINQRKELGIFW